MRVGQNMLKNIPVVLFPYSDNSRITLDASLCLLVPKLCRHNLTKTKVDHTINTEDHCTCKMCRNDLEGVVQVVRLLDHTSFLERPCNIMNRVNEQHVLQCPNLVPSCIKSE